MQPKFRIMHKPFLLFLFLLISIFSQAQDDSQLWLRYPSISPDGSEILFNHQGDIYKVGINGGNAVPISISESYDYGAIWSRDGKKVAFSSDRHGNMDVFVMPSNGGAAKRLTFHSYGERPTCFSPDGSEVYFVGHRQDAHTNVQFPSGVMAELYKVSVDGGKVDLVLTSPAHDATLNSEGSRLIFHDRKGYENQWRKHHTSAVTRDIWTYNFENEEYQQLSTFEGENRNPVFASDDDTYYYLSEENGVFNVYKSSLSAPGRKVQITNFDHHPVRFLSISEDDKLCFGYHGGIYTLTEGGSPQKLDVNIAYDGRVDLDEIKPVNGSFTEATLSPSGKEVAYIYRGEIFVSSVEEGTTKRITNTPWQERSVCFSPDGRSLIYAQENADSWDVLKTTIKREAEPYFYMSTMLEVDTVIATDKDEFQPAISPDGKEVAYLEDRQALKVVNLDSRKSRLVMGPEHNYSYSDGDQWYQWSPDSKWFLVSYGPPERMFWSEVGLVSADGTGGIRNLTESGYADFVPKWSSDGKMMIWGSTREGMRYENGYVGTGDVYAMYFTKEGWDEAQMSKEELEVYKEMKEKEKEKEKDDEGEDKKKKKGKKEKDDEDEDNEDGEEKVEPLTFDWDGLSNRKKRLTGTASRINDWLISKDGEKLFYLTRFEGQNDMWVTELRTKETKKLCALGKRRVGMELSDDGETILVIGDGKIYTVKASDGSKKSVNTQGEMIIKHDEERAYIFDHCWRLLKNKFYVEDMQGVDWEFYREAYRPFLPNINNNYDFAEMLSEMLGELNASHTGSGYRAQHEGEDETSALGLLYDHEYDGQGIKVAEILQKGPFDNGQTKVEAGHVINTIDGHKVTKEIDFYQLLNRRRGERVLVEVLDPSNGKSWEEVVTPISLGQENQLMYERWVETRRAEVVKRSEGRLGYVHVRSMSDPSMRVVIEDALGKHISAEALIVDTRFNGGGNLHDVLADFLNGKKYMDVIPHGQYVGSQPWSKWNKPSIVIMGESNYSDAHLFPVAYKIKEVGQTLGMPVPGTGTFVWWETQIDPTVYFGIPMGGWKPLGQPFLENSQLEPDIRVPNEPGMMAKGVDQQLNAAVDELLKQLDN